MAEFAQLDIVRAVASALLHFLWQGVLIALAAAVLMRTATSASVRYGVGIVAMVLMLATPAATVFVLSQIQHVQEVASIVSAPIGAGVPAVEAAAASSGAGSASAASGLWPAAGVFAWLLGIGTLSIRLAGGWLVARRMATEAVRPATVQVQLVAAAVAERLALRRAVRVLESSVVAVPVLVGWLRPTIVFPIAALAGLSPAQIEALLAHELAHVRRHDYLVNLLQSLAEVVLFYHPAVWWLSRRVRMERELCCDDLAVGICDRLVYATALTDLAAMRMPGVALAATGGDLLARVRRILGHEEIAMSSKVRWIPALVITGAAVIAVPVLMASVSSNPPHVPVAAAAAGVDAVAAEQHAVVRHDAVHEQRPVVAPAREEQRLIAELAAYEAALVDMQRSVETREQERRNADRAQQAEIEAARANLQAARRLFETGLVAREHLIDAEKKLAMAEAGRDERRRGEVEIEHGQRELEEAQRRFRAGVISRDEVARVEAALERLRAHGDEQRLRELELVDKVREIERARELVAKGLMADSQAREIERRELQRAVGERLKERDSLYTAELQERLREVRAAARDVEAQAQERRRALRDERPVEISPEGRRPMELERVASRPIVAGDSLFITFEGESTLPTIYRIDGNGTIRVPLLGSFKVIGQTPGQVREAIGKKLLDAKLGSPAKVTVELRAPRR